MQEILKRLKFITDKNIEQIANEIGLSRSYFNNEVNKGVNEEIKNKMLEYENKLKQDVPREARDKVRLYFL